MGYSVIIAAAGKGTRMGGIDKPLVEINGKKAIFYSVSAFEKAGNCDKIIIVVSSDNYGKIEAELKKYNCSVPIEITLGGSTRQKSASNGFLLCDKKSDVVMIHDAARPLVLPCDIANLYNFMKEKNINGAALGVYVKDTVKVVDKNGKILCTPERSGLMIAQTPQAFEVSLYKKALFDAQENGKDYTDDCQLFEAIGQEVYIVNGHYDNIKLTTVDDISAAENYLRERNK